MVTFLSLPVEIRLQVYSELLVYPGRLQIVKMYYWSQELFPWPTSRAWRYNIVSRPRPPGGFLSSRDRKAFLYPAILRTNKTIYNEALPVLYSLNHFGMPQGDGHQPVYSLNHFAMPHDDFHRPVSIVEPFLGKLGQEAAPLIRRLGMFFPNGFGYNGMPKKWMENLEYIITHCPGLQTLELIWNSKMSVCQHGRHEQNHDQPSPSPALEFIDIIDQRCKALPNLKKIVLNVDPRIFELSPSVEIEPSGPSFDKMRTLGWKCKKRPDAQFLGSSLL